jgi:hypothetical protein
VDECIDDGCRQPEDWYRVGHADFAKIGGTALLVKYGSISNLLAATLPEFNWNAEYFQNGSTTKSQIYLYSILSELNIAKTTGISKVIQ